MIAYQWNPYDSRKGVVPWPHVHVGKDLPHSEMLQRDREHLGSLSSAHLPTGLVPFPHVLRMAIRDFGVMSIRHHGESDEDADRETTSSFARAVVALKQSFGWWNSE